MKQLFMAISCFLGFASQAQTSITLYQNIANYTSLSNINHYSSYYSPNRSVNSFPLSSFSIAINKTRKNKRYAELELGTFQNFKISDSINYYDSLGNFTGFTNTEYKYTSARIRYERGQTILSGDFKKRNWSFLLGHSLQLHTENYRNSPLSSNIFPTTTTKLRTSYHIIPRIKVNLNKIFSFDANMPIHIIKAGVISQSTSDPTIPLDLQKYSLFDVDLFTNETPMIGLRLGMTYKLK